MPTLKTYIVEDSPVIRENLIATLEELGPVQVVGWASDEAGALRWLDDPGNDASLVIVDIFLNSGSGLGVLRHAARRPDGRHMVVLSNYATADVRTKCIELGAERVFDKSGDIDDLLAYCRSLAAGAPNEVAGLPAPA